MSSSLALSGAGALAWPRRATLALWLATAVFAVLGAWSVSALGRPVDYGIYALTLMTAAAPLTAGYLVSRQQPENWVGPCLTAAGAAMLLIVAHGNWQDALAADPHGLPASPLLNVLTQGVWMGWFVPYALAIALFPDGRPWGRLGRCSVAALLGIPVLFNLLTAVVPGDLMPPLNDWPRPLGTHPIGYLSLGLLPLFLAALVGSALSLARRHRATEQPAARAQLRWMLLASAVLPLTLLLCWAGYLLVHNPAPVVVGLIAMNVAIPAAALVAMLRHELYDVDTAIVRVGAYSLLALFVMLGYAAISGLIGRALGEDSVTAAVAATVVVMVALLPLRALLLRALGRRLHPRRTAALDALRDLADRVNAGSVAPESLEAVLRRSLRDPGLRVGYRQPGETAYLDVGGADVDPARGQVISSLGHDVGVIVPGPAGAPVPAEVTAATGLLAEAVRMRSELAGALAEVDASRQRLLRAGDAERRRLEMDLHDGAQQHLVSLGMRLRVAQRHVRSGKDVDVDALVDRAVEEIAAAVGELRAIAHGLRPSSLDDGLPAALDNLTRSSALPVRISYAAGPLPDHVGLTAYYVANEALANAVKHAGATEVDIAVDRLGKAVRLGVRDDGAGGARVVAGSGLSGLRDRVEALGGTLAVDSPVGGGTRVEAVIPCES